jgi:hypothetical protein
MRNRQDPVPHFLASTFNLPFGVIFHRNQPLFDCIQRPFKTIDLRLEPVNFVDSG